MSNFTQFSKTVGWDAYTPTHSFVILAIIINIFVLFAPLHLIKTLNKDKKSWTNYRPTLVTWACYSIFLCIGTLTLTLFWYYGDQTDDSGFALSLNHTFVNLAATTCNTILSSATVKRFSRLLYLEKTRAERHMIRFMKVIPVILLLFTIPANIWPLIANRIHINNDIGQVFTNTGNICSIVSSLLALVVGAYCHRQMIKASMKIAIEDENLELSGKPDVKAQHQHQMASVVRSWRLKQRLYLYWWILLIGDGFSISLLLLCQYGTFFPYHAGKSIAFSMSSLFGWAGFQLFNMYPEGRTEKAKDSEVLDNQQSLAEFGPSRFSSSKSPNTRNFPIDKSNNNEFVIDYENFNQNK